MSSSCSEGCFWALVYSIDLEIFLLFEELSFKLSRHYLPDFLFGILFLLFLFALRVEVECENELLVVRVAEQVNWE